MAREFSRHERLGNQIQRTLSELLRFETKDPRLHNVSLTAVDLSRDLSVARVYFSLLDP
ncbi:MAG: ribosome-binding factor A, partial [Woeseiaceae bacterium]